MRRIVCNPHALPCSPHPSSACGGVRSALEPARATGDQMLDSCSSTPGSPAALEVRVAPENFLPRVHCSSIARACLPWSIGTYKQHSSGAPHNHACRAARKPQNARARTATVLEQMMSTATRTRAGCGCGRAHHVAGVKDLDEREPAALPDRRRRLAVDAPRKVVRAMPRVAAGPLKLVDPAAVAKVVAD